MLLVLLRVSYSPVVSAGRATQGDAFRSGGREPGFAGRVATPTLRAKGAFGWNVLFRSKKRKRPGKSPKNASKDRKNVANSSIVLFLNILLSAGSRFATVGRRRRGPGDQGGDPDGQGREREARCRAEERRDSPQEAQSLPSNVLRTPSTHL